MVSLYFQPLTTLFHYYIHIRVKSMNILIEFKQPKSHVQLNVYVLKPLISYLSTVSHKKWYTILINSTVLHEFATCIIIIQV